jgi:HK97 family phage prohead protease
MTATAYRSKIVRNDEIREVPWSPALPDGPRRALSSSAPARSLLPTRASVKQLSPSSGGCSTGCECKPCSPPVNAKTREPEIPADAMEFGKPCVLLGYASVTGAPYDFKGVPEAIRPGAFHAVLSSGGSISALYGHSWGDYIGSTGSGSLFLREDAFGLLAAILPDSKAARQAARFVRQGFATAMSIGRCSPPDQRAYVGPYEGWQNRFGQLSIGEVSIVERPANGATSIECFAMGDRPRFDLARERDLIGQEALTAGMPSFVRAEALLKLRRERGQLRLCRLAASLLGNDLFTRPLPTQRKMIREAMAQM